MGTREEQDMASYVLIPNWSLGKPAALDLTVAPPLNANFFFSETSVTAGSKLM